MTARKNKQTQSVSGSELWFDGKEAVFINETPVANSQIFDALRAQRPEIAALMRWQQGLTARGQRGGIFQRDRFTTPYNVFDQFRVAKDAATSDDVVTGVLEASESMAFSKVGFECDDEDQEDIWNQIACDIDLDSRLREMWRELFIVSQFYAAIIWGNKDFKVRGKSDKGVARKKQYNNLRVPIGITMLDPLKVLPVGNFMFNQERLVYIAELTEAENFDLVLAGANTTDLIVTNLIQERYDPTPTERVAIADITGSDVTNLYLMNPKNVFRHTLTRPQYERFADVRMRSVFELLDLKNQLREMDRASLLGGTNFIVLVRIGSDAIPAKQSEISALSGMVQAAARVPIIIGDHRLDVEIITPKQDYTLKPERYNTLDSRITSRLFKILNSGNYASGTKGDDSLKLSRVIAAGMESTRHMMRRALEVNMIRPTMDLNPNRLTDEPTLNFYPHRIALDFDPALAQFYQDLRDRGDISRDTMLNEIDLNQEQEAQKRQREKQRYDKIFEPTNVPFDSPTKTAVNPVKKAAAVKKVAATPKAAGRQGGGKKNGGGLNPDAGRPPNS